MRGQSGQKSRQVSFELCFGVGDGLLNRTWCLPPRFTFTLWFSGFLSTCNWGRLCACSSLFFWQILHLGLSKIYSAEANFYSLWRAMSTILILSKTVLPVKKDKILTSAANLIFLVNTSRFSSIIWAKAVKSASPYFFLTRMSSVYHRL